jgi:adenosylhomocysteine nucleosidase
MLDLAIFTALDWERRAVAPGLVGLEAAATSRTWRGRLGDGSSCLVAQTGVGAERARTVAASIPPARAFLVCGCAGALADWLRPGDLVAGDAVTALDTAGRPVEQLPAAAAMLAAWALARGFRVHRGVIACSPSVLGTARAKADAAVDGALVVEMESAAVAAEARARGIPFVALRVVLDGAREEIGPLVDAVDPATGDLRARRVLAALGPRPWLWPRALRLGRQTRLAERRLRTVMAAVLGAGMEALVGRPEPASAVAN